MNFEFPYDPFRELRFRALRTVRNRVSRIPGVVADVALDVVRRELQELRSDVSAALAYLGGLPERMQKAVAYEFFASFFDHYLPKRFLWHYIYGSGDLVLTEKEMIDCGPYISVVRSKAFLATLKELSLPTQKKPVTKKLSIGVPAGALTNGTLGQFTVKMNGDLTYLSATDWSFGGEMTFYDEWDFDPKDWTTGGRSFQGEVKTRFAHYTLPGKSFKILSKEVPFTQSSSDATVVWKGGTPVSTPDRIAALDIALKNAE